MKERAKKAEERYVDQAGVLDRNLHATTVRRDHDGDVAAIPTMEQVQRGLRMRSMGVSPTVRAV